MPNYCEIDVSLLHIKPKIWRRFHLPATATFGDLNEAIQFCGPWGGGHLWMFQRAGRGGDIIAEMKYPGMDEDPYGFGEEPIPDADDVPLNAVLNKKGDKCIYLYDFGDSWEHEVKLRKVFESDEKFQRRLIDGERNFPPDDCGGVGGYYECLLALGRIEWTGPPEVAPVDDVEARREWLGDWDPEEFDLEKVKARFDKPKPRKTPAVKKKAPRKKK